MAAIAAGVQPSVVQVRGGRHSSASGIVWGRGNAVMTNFHVVIGAGPRPDVLSANDRLYRARLVAANPRLDLALLELDDADLPPAALGDSARLRVGELVFAIGNPWGQRGVVTAGIVSAVGDLPAAPGEPPASYIRSDVRLAPGNSGGPLLNARGEVVGINAMILGGDLSVAIPSHVAAAWVQRLSKRTPFLGLAVQPAALARTSRTNGQHAGLRVVQVAPRGPAARAGLRPDDVLLTFNGVPLPAAEHLIEALSRCQPGDTARLEVLRDGMRITAAVTLAERDDL